MLQESLILAWGKQGLDRKVKATLIYCQHQWQHLHHHLKPISKYAENTREVLYKQTTQ